MLSIKSFIAALAAFSSLASCAPAPAPVPAPAALERRLPGRVVKAGEPVVLDPNGEYVRVSFANDGSLIGGYMAKESGTSILKFITSTDGAVTVSNSFKYPTFACNYTHFLYICGIGGMAARVVFQKQ